MRIVHAIRSDGFAGVERHVARLAGAQRAAGHQVLVLGGDPTRMIESIDDPLVGVVPARTTWDVVRALRRWARGADVVHTHMTAAEVAAASARVLTMGSYSTVVSTRHFAGPRGRGRLGRITARVAAAPISAQIAISQYVADSIGEPSTVVAPGIAIRPDGRCAAQRDRVVLLAQRLEPEKRTDIAVRAFAASQLSARGWEMHIAGDGSQRADLERLARDLGVDATTRFLGMRDDVDDLMATSGILLAPCPIEGLGLSVVEAMAAGLPVVAAGAGGHLELLDDLDPDALYDPADPAAAARSLVRLAESPQRRDAYADAARTRQRTQFSPAAQAAATDAVYRQAQPGDPHAAAPSELVVLSLEAWDDVWRRNQYFVTNMVADAPDLRVLFVEPAADPMHQCLHHHRPRAGAGIRPLEDQAVHGADRIRLFQPTKWLPRRIDPWADARLSRQVIRAARRVGFHSPVLWVNDPAGADLATTTGWPAVYDVTDDWLAAKRTAQEHRRLVRDERLLLAGCREVTVCSEHLARAKGTARKVTLISNGVDVNRYTEPRPRPSDLPAGPVALYLGTVHPDRFDVRLLVETAKATVTGSVAVVGPVVDLSEDDLDEIGRYGVRLLGPRPWDTVPAYLQHASVLLVPHLINAFTDSLDPIKLYEYLAVGLPVVSTPVAGFRDWTGPLIRCVTPDEFPSAVAAALEGSSIRRPPPADLPTWRVQSASMWSAICRAWSSGSGLPDAGDHAR